MNISVHHIHTCIHRNGVEVYTFTEGAIHLFIALLLLHEDPWPFHASRTTFISRVFFRAQNKYKDPSLLFIPSRMISLAKHGPSCSAWFLKRCNKSFCLEQTRAWLLNNEISSPNATFSPNMLPHADTDLARGEHATCAERTFVPEDVEGDAD